MILELENNLLVVIQPILTSYRQPFFNELSEHFKTVNVYADLNVGEGFKSDISGNFNSIHTEVLGNRKTVYYQRGIIFDILKSRPSTIFITADFRALHFWLILIISKILNISIFSHGQGLYNKPNPSLLHKLMFKVTTALSDSYICYTDSVFNSLIAIGINKKYLSIMDNTIVNTYTVTPSEKLADIHKRILYIGRLREGSNLELLFEAMHILKLNGKEVVLDIVGDGTEKKKYETIVNSLNLNVKFFGAVYDNKIIQEISKNSSIGIYPGDAGLSLVHYMSLSLVPIIHDDLTKHMGPEPSYIKHGINGLTFERNDAKSLAKTIETLLGNESMIKKLSRSAFDTYMSLSKPTMAEKLIEIMKPYLKENITI